MHYVEVLWLLLLKQCVFCFNGLFLHTVCPFVEKKYTLSYLKKKKNKEIIYFTFGSYLSIFF